MLLNARLARRAVVGVIGTGAVAGAVLIGAAPSALADPPPNCTAADLAGVAAGVSAATSAYLFTHPEVNAFITGLKGVPKEQRREQLRVYGDAHPDQRAEVQAIRQPLEDFRMRCGSGDSGTVP